LGTLPPKVLALGEKMEIFNSLRITIPMKIKLMSKIKDKIKDQGIITTNSYDRNYQLTEFIGFFIYFNSKLAKWKLILFDANDDVNCRICENKVSSRELGIHSYKCLIRKSFIDKIGKINQEVKVLADQGKSISHLYNKTHLGISFDLNAEKDDPKNHVNRLSRVMLIYAISLKI
jgi:hypothetical protein